MQVVGHTALQQALDKHGLQAQNRAAMMETARLFLFAKTLALRTSLTGRDIDDPDYQQELDHALKGARRVTNSLLSDHRGQGDEGMVHRLAHAIQVMGGVMAEITKEQRGT